MKLSYIHIQEGFFMKVHWKQLILSPSGMNRLEVMTSRRFNDKVIAEEAVTYIIDGLSENNWKRLNSFSGGSKPETYFHSVSLNLMEEFARKRFGRPRPPEWLKRESPIWQNVWQMMCLERQPVGYVIDTFCTKERRSPEFVSGIIKTIKARLPWCGARNGRIPINHLDSSDDSFDSEVILESQLSLEQSIDKQELEDRLFLFSELLKNIISPSNNSSHESKRLNLDELQSLQAKLDFTQEELIIVRMAFQEGLRLNLIAKSLNMPSYQPGRILKRVFKTFMEAMKESGMDVDGLQTLIMEADL